MKTATKLFTLLELPITMVIMCAFVTSPISVFAAPDKKAFDDSAVSQVKESLRQITEAATLLEKAGGCSMRDCTDVDKLVAVGKISKAPTLPSGIGVVDDAPPYYSATESALGGCGIKNTGAPLTANIALKNVSEQFCQAYNESVGLGSNIIKNCSSGGDCTVSGSKSPYDFPIVNSSSFCFLRNDTFAIVWLTTISSTPCDKK